MAEKKDQTNTGLNQLEIEQLEELLCVSLDSQEDSDTDKILDLLQMIEDRKNQSQSVPDLDIDKAWETFQSVYASENVLYPVETAHHAIEKRSRKKRLSLRRVWIGVAVAACLLALAIPTAMGTELFQRMIGTWTEQEFQFESQMEDVPSETSVLQGNIQMKNDYTDLQQALEHYNIEEKVVPTYIPQGYKLADIAVTELEDLGRINFYACYENGTNSISMSYIYYLSAQESTKVYEKDRRDVQEYKINSGVYYFFQNSGDITVTWFTNHMECALYSDLSDSELKKMIDSI